MREMRSDESMLGSETNKKRNDLKEKKKKKTKQNKNMLVEVCSRAVGFEA